MDEQGRNHGDELTLAPVNVITRKRPKALWGVLAAVAVAAGALAVTSGDGDDDAAPLLPIALGSSGAERPASTSAADSMLAWVIYVAGDDLPAVGGTAPAYKLSGTVDEAQVRALADALGLGGKVVQQDGIWTVTGGGGATLEVSEDGGGGWWFSAGSPDVSIGSPGAGVGDCVEATSADGTGTVTECAPVTTRAPSPYEECPPGADCAAVVEEPTEPACADGEAGDCPGSIEPPADLPSEDEARVIALDLLAAGGMDTGDAVVTVDGPYDAWYVTVEPRIDGVPTGLIANVSVGSAGAITSAGGHLGTPVRLGDYPRLDTRAAIDRLNAHMEGGDWFSSSPGAARDIAVATGEVRDATVTTSGPTTVPPCKVQPDGSGICEGSGAGAAPPPRLPECPDLVLPADEPRPEDAAADCALVGPVPVPMPEAEPTEVVLTAAAPSLVLVPANDGSVDAYLVPGYRFTGEDGAQVDAAAVAEEALTGPPPPEPPVTGTVDTTIVPDPGGTDGGSTPPSGCETLVEEDASGTTRTIQPCIGVDPSDSVEPPMTPATKVPETTTTVGD